MYKRPLQKMPLEAEIREYRATLHGVWIVLNKQLAWDFFKENIIIILSFDKGKGRVPREKSQYIGRGYQEWDQLLIWKEGLPR